MQDVAINNQHTEHITFNQTKKNIKTIATFKINKS